MDRMLRMNKDNSDYEIDRELTWKFAIEKNAEYQDRIEELEEENRKLNEKVRFLEESIRELRKEKENLKKENRIKELYEDEEEAELLNYLDENLDEI